MSDEHSDVNGLSRSLQALTGRVSNVEDQMQTLAKGVKRVEVLENVTTEFQNQSLIDRNEMKQTVEALGGKVDKIEAQLAPIVEMDNGIRFLVSSVKWAAAMVMLAAGTTAALLYFVGLGG